MLLRFLPVIQVKKWNWSLQVAAFSCSFHMKFTNFPSILGVTALGCVINFAYTSNLTYSTKLQRHLCFIYALPKSNEVSKHKHGTLLVQNQSDMHDHQQVGLVIIWLSVSKHQNKSSIPTVLISHWAPFTVHSNNKLNSMASTHVNIATHRLWTPYPEFSLHRIHYAAKFYSRKFHLPRNHVQVVYSPVLMVNQTKKSFPNI